METKLPKVADEEEARAQLAIWEYVFGFTPMAVVKCAIRLQIPDVLEAHGGAITHSDLSAALACSPSVLHRIMRYLIHRGFFEQESDFYVQTPLSRLLAKNAGGNSMADFILMESSPPMVDPWHELSTRALLSEASPFKAQHGEDVWAYAAANPSHSKLINDAMACHARLAMSAITERYPEAFKGVETVVDVGGGDGTTLRTLVKACPWVRGINLDLPHVVSVAPQCDGIEHVAGNMFEMVPKADAAFLMWVLHDWSDEECIQILTRCREAIPEDRGKVVIAEAVIGSGEDEYSDMRLALDMVMLAHTEKGKERTVKEWEHVIKSAGFKKFSVKDIQSVVSVIEAYP